MATKKALSKSKTAAAKKSSKLVPATKKGASKSGQKEIKKSPPAKKLTSQTQKASAPLKKSMVKSSSGKSTIKHTKTKSQPKKVLALPKKSVPVTNTKQPLKKLLTKKPAFSKSQPLPKKVNPVQKPAVAAPSHKEVKPAIKPLQQTSAIKKEAPKPARPMVVPKTSTTKSVKYEPDFTKSVLDRFKRDEGGPTMRYSDGELIEFRDLINRKLDTAKKELNYLQGLITRKDESGDLDEGRYMTMEDGSMSMEREQLSQMASRQIQFIDHLEKAIMRIENKTYGVCRVTGKLIDKARLRAVPHATLSMEAKQLMNK